MRPNKHVHPVGGMREVLPRPKTPAPQALDPQLAAMMRLIEEANADQAKTDAKNAKVRLPFLLTNPERRSTEEKKPGMVRLHQCSFDAGKLERCNCEYIKAKDAAKLEESGEGTYLDGLTHMRLRLNKEEWIKLLLQRTSEREQRNRESFDQKNAAQRQKTYKEKTAELIKDFQRLRETQDLHEVLDEGAVLGMLETLEGLDAMFSKATALYAAKQIAHEYWGLIMDRDNLGEDRGDKVTGSGDKLVTWGSIEKIAAARETDTGRVKPAGHGPNPKDSNDEQHGT